MRKIKTIVTTVILIRFKKKCYLDLVLPLNPQLSTLNSQRFRPGAKHLKLFGLKLLKSQKDLNIRNLRGYKVMIMTKMLAMEALTACD
jgi:hypothetical protein